MTMVAEKKRPASKGADEQERETKQRTSKLQRRVTNAQQLAMPLPVAPQPAKRAVTAATPSSNGNYANGIARIPVKPAPKAKQQAAKAPAIPEPRSGKVAAIPPIQATKAPVQRKADTQPPKSAKATVTPQAPAASRQQSAKAAKAVGPAPVPKLAKRVEASKTAATKPMQSKAVKPTSAPRTAKPVKRAKSTGTLPGAASKPAATKANAKMLGGNSKRLSANGAVAAINGHTNGRSKNGVNGKTAPLPKRSTQKKAAAPAGFQPAAYWKSKGIAVQYIRGKLELEEQETAINFLESGQQAEVSTTNERWMRRIENMRIRPLAVNVFAEGGESRFYRIPKKLIGLPSQRG